MNKEERVITFGCRLNACESETICEFAAELGLETYTIINSCAVTAEAERKLQQTIRSLFESDENIKIILTGCASELHPEFYLKMNGVVGIISNKMKLSRTAYEKYAAGQLPLAKDAVSKTYKNRIRGFLQIQNGCDHKCTYCVVRLARGPSVSFSPEDIVARAKNMLAKGYREIVLTGVNISSYSGGLGGLIRFLLKQIPQLKRLRLSSLDPADMNDELLKIFAGEERLMPHLHESIQSGDNLLLRRMLRRHTAEQVVEINEKILALRPDVVLGADLITGFPTETDEMFENTKKLLQNAHVSLAHVFPFSPRPATPAYAMPQVPRRVCLSRALELRTLAKALGRQKMLEFIGKTSPALAESEFFAKTNSFLQIKSREKLVPGEAYLFDCEDCEKTYIIGRPVKVNG
ncbi:MAG: MiaB/RimO family radical SAM methylthiotransferase [Holosporaceae bacterium]|jgi:threonylcarbamoyladenosine tRNA methylthiotransferase MtaB|nr:MiaB/RimO family radical SAM methylthiotransferase [Holosporaceae bacterium]